MWRQIKRMGGITVHDEFRTTLDSLQGPQQHDIGQHPDHQQQKHQATADNDKTEQTGKAVYRIPATIDHEHNTGSNQRQTERGSGYEAKPEIPTQRHGDTC
jgi:hypothetical protein